MFHKIKSVTPLDDFVLRVTFAEGATKAYDIKPLIDDINAFSALRDTPGLYQLAHVDTGGYAVAWNDDIDIACDELWAKGELVQTPFDNLLSFGDATALWGLNESTLRKAISYGKIKEGVDAQKYGKKWIVTIDAMRREYGNPKHIEP